MYSEKLAIALKVNGQVLREFGDTVRLPFGSEYSLFIKNLNSVKANVRIEIDGSDIADGDTFIVPANGSIDIERFLKGRNQNIGNRFKFIERNSKVEAGRGGIQVEDGLIRIEFEFERELAPLKDYSTPWVNPGFYPTYKPYWHASYGGVLNNVTSTTYSTNGGGRGSSLGSSSYGTSLGSADEQCYTANACSIPIGASVAKGLIPPDVVRSRGIKNEAGITAPGSVSEQKFVTGYIGALDGVKHVVVMKLLGEVGHVKVKKPVTVKSKQRCVTCNHLNKTVAKFCVECGTGLAIVTSDRVVYGFEGDE